MYLYFTNEQAITNVIRNLTEIAKLSGLSLIILGRIADAPEIAFLERKGHLTCTFLGEHLELSRMVRLHMNGKHVWVAKYRIRTIH